MTSRCNSTGDYVFLPTTVQMGHDIKGTIKDYSLTLEW
jgi:hypothetical protein